MSVDPAAFVDLVLRLTDHDVPLDDRDLATMALLRECPPSTKDIGAIQRLIVALRIPNEEWLHRLQLALVLAAKWADTGCASRPKKKGGAKERGGRTSGKLPSGNFPRS